MKKLELNKLIREEISKVLKEDGNDEWTQGDVGGVYKATMLTLKSLAGAKRNIDKLSSEIVKHTNKPQGSVLGKMIDENNIMKIDDVIIKISKIKQGLDKE
jgi:hypothetical protein